MPEPFHLPGGKKPKDTDRKIDTEKRYDVYSGEHGQPATVHRNVLFKGTRYLFDQGNSYASGFNEFIELEQSNNQSIFITRHRILFFCEHGTELMIERVKHSQD
jgi:hypothetical protein